MSKTKTFKIISVLLAVVLYLEAMVFLFMIPSSAAEAAGDISYLDTTSIYDDLKSVGIDVDYYPANQNGEIQYMYFTEFCYSEEGFGMDDIFSLYVWIYNPKQTPLNVQGSNVINISFGAEYSNQPLTFVSCTSDHRFYKFRITDSKSALNSARQCAEVNDGMRIYNLASVQLQSGSLIPKDNNISTKFIFSGYAKGCSEYSQNYSTLSVTKDGLETITLSLNHTTWRNRIYDFSLTNKDFTCDSISSVYFGIPSKYLEEYKSLQQITAEWVECLSKPIFVTSSSTAYNRLKPYLGQSVGEGNNNLHMRVLWEQSDYYYETAGGNSGAYGLQWKKTYNGKKLEDGKYVDMFPSRKYTFQPGWSYEDTMYWLFYVEGVEKWEDYKISSQELQDFLSNNSKNKDLLSRYDSDFFVSCENVNTTVSADDLLNFEQSTGLTVWDVLFGKGEMQETKKISPIYVLSSAEMRKISLYDAFNPEHVKEFEEKYYIENDNTGSDSGNVLLDFQDIIASGSIPVLYRFAKDDYYCSEARFDSTAAYHGEPNTSKNISDINGYVAQEMMYFNFDIISLGFLTNNEDEIVTLSVVANPIDVIPGLIAPNDIPIEQEEWWQKIMMILCIILLIALLTAFGGPISLVLKILWDGIWFVVKAVFTVITLPFRLIFGLFRR